MDKLPSELLFKIMLYLHPVDRLSCSLTCRRLAEIMTSSQLLDDVWLNIAGHEMEAAASVLVNSRRQYKKMLLYKANLWEFDSEFWEKIGANLCVLELERCSWSAHVFYDILQQCSELEFLKLMDGKRRIRSNLPTEDFVLPEGVCHAKVRSSLSNLRHLHLEFALTADILEFLLELMPNVTSIFLSSTSYEGPDFSERLSSMLKTHRNIHIVEYCPPWGIRSEDIIRFMEVTSESLKELRISTLRMDRITENACDAIFNCTRLRSLTFDGFIDAHRLRRLVSNSPNLEMLDLWNTRALNDDDMVHLLELKNLRNLRLVGTDNMKSEFLRGLWGISTLVKLDLTTLNVDSEVLRSLGRLTNLRSLLLSACRGSECFQVICENFERLTELNLGDVRSLKDDDGSKLCRFKELQSLSFRFGYEFTDLTFANGVGSRTMKSLSIHGSPITDAGLMRIASHHDYLQSLSFGSCPLITDRGIKALLRNEPRLTKLWLRYCGLVRGYERTTLRDLYPRLRDLDII